MRLNRLFVVGLARCRDHQHRVPVNRREQENRASARRTDSSALRSLSWDLMNWCVKKVYRVTVRISLYRCRQEKDASTYRFGLLQLVFERLDLILQCRSLVLESLSFSLRHSFACRARETDHAREYTRATVTYAREGNSELTQTLSPAR